MTLRDFIREKVIFMTNRAAFFATTRECFICQMMILLEMYGGISLTEAHRLMHQRRDLWHQVIDDGWAKELGFAALRLLDAADVTYGPGWRNHGG